MPIQARNNFVFIIRDEIQEEILGFIIPGQGQEKPHKGRVFSVGDLVVDKKIKQDTNCLFHKGSGFDITFEGVTYLVIEGERIICTV